MFWKQPYKLPHFDASILKYWKLWPKEAACYFNFKINIFFGFLGGSVKRIPLPMQETWVRSLIWEDPTCHGATKLTHHIYEARALEPRSHNYWAHVWHCSPRALEPGSTPRKATAISPPLQLEGSPCSPQLEKSLHSNEDPAQPKINKLINIDIYFKIMVIKSFDTWSYL